MGLLLEGVAILLGCGACAWLVQQHAVSPTLASASLLLLSSFIPLRSSKNPSSIRAAFGMGTFIGMDSSQIVAGPAALVLLVLLGLCLTILARPYFRGVGGRMGALAFITTALYVFLSELARVWT